MWCPEEEKNEKEKREEKSMPALFMEINRQYGMRCMQRIREIGIQQGQMPIIMIVYRHNGCSQKEIAEWMGNTAHCKCKYPASGERRTLSAGNAYKDHACIYLTENGRKSWKSPAGKQSCGESDVQQFEGSGSYVFYEGFLGRFLDTGDTLPTGRN